MTIDTGARHRSGALAPGDRVTSRATPSPRPARAGEAWRQGLASRSPTAESGVSWRPRPLQAGQRFSGHCAAQYKISREERKTVENSRPNENVRGARRPGLVVRRGFLGDRQSEGSWNSGKRAEKFEVVLGRVRVAGFWPSAQRAAHRVPGKEETWEILADCKCVAAMIAFCIASLAAMGSSGSNADCVADAVRVIPKVNSPATLYDSFVDFAAVMTGLFPSFLRKPLPACSRCNGLLSPRCSHSQPPIRHSSSSFSSISTQQPPRRTCVESPSTPSIIAQTDLNLSAPICAKPPRLFSEGPTLPRCIPISSPRRFAFGLYAHPRRGCSMRDFGALRRDVLSWRGASRTAASDAKTHATTRR